MEEKKNKKKNKNENNVYSVGIYARLSVDHGIKKESIASQIAIAKTYLEQQKGMVLFDCYIDLGESGTHFKRAGFLQLMEDIRAGKVNCVIVKDFSRFGRNYLEVGNYIDKIFPFLGIRFISVADGFDSSKQEESGIDRNLKNLIDEMYVYDTARKVKQVKQLYREQGNYIGSRAPYGYQILMREGKRELIIEKDAFAIVEKMVQLYLEGKSQKEIVSWLYQNRVHRPSDYKRTGHLYCMEGETLLEWQKGNIRQILDRFGVNRKDRKKEKRQKNGFVVEQREEQKEKKSMAPTIGKGLLYCGDCKQELSVRNDLKKRIFFCSQARRMDRLQCKRKQISEEMLFSCIAFFLKSMIQKMPWGEGRFCDVEGKALEEYCQKKRKEYRKKKELEMKRIEIQIIAIERMISESYRAYQIGTIEKEWFFAKKVKEKEKIESLKKQKEKRLQEIQRVEQQIKKVWDGKTWYYKIVEENTFFPTIIKRIELFSEKRIRIQLCIRRGK